MRARSKARKRAVDVLYESDLRGTDPIRTLAERLAAGTPPIPDYAVDLVEGVVREQAEIDAIVSSYAEGWTLARMPAVDRALLRLATYELLYRPDVPAAVVIDEAIELAKMLSTDDSPRFINGVLGRVVREVPSRAQPPEPSGTVPAGAAPADVGTAEMDRAEMGTAEMGTAEAGRAEVGRAEVGRADA